MCVICEAKNEHEGLEVNKENLLQVIAAGVEMLNTAGAELAKCPVEYGPTWLEALDILGQNLVSLSVVLAADAHAVGRAMSKETLRIRMSN